MKQPHDEYDVLLAYPSGRDFLSGHSNMIPLGIASIAAVLESHNYKVKIVDFNFYNGKFTEDLKRWNPKIVGIGGTTPTRKGSFEIARLVKETLPDIPVVYGGPHATFCVKDTFDNVPHIDYIIKGEGEFPFLDLCSSFVRNIDVSIHSIPGLCCRKHDNRITENKPVRINDLGELPVPARHFFDEGNYFINLEFNNVEAAVIITSRGCPVCCSFCSASRMFPGGVRTRPISSVKDEVDLLVKSRKIRGLKIFDSTLTADRQHVLDFCKMIKEYNLLWECEIRADTVDYELLKTMKEAGCYYVDIGLETTNERLLKKLGKKIRVAQVENVLDWCKDLGIKTKVFIIFGHIGQTFSECLKDVKYVREYKKKIDYFANNIGLKVYPGTTLERQAIESNLIPRNFSWAKYEPPIKNLLFLEFDDVLILDQKQLSFFKLVIIGMLLNLQNTNLSSEYYKKLAIKVVSNMRRLVMGRGEG